MRLLKSRSAGGGFELISFSDDLAPPYAILSHTWTDGQEVTYNELLAGAGADKRGYAKIRFCGEQAAADGLEYFWVDTCCIDKSKSDELSTAINSIVEFFSQDGKRLGSRISLEQEIHSITSIPINALRGQKLTEFSVEERTGWAAKRTTTVAEDRVYCLLGIFGVFLPLIYGEGEEYATLRLKEEIQKRQQRRENVVVQDLSGVY
ncbi:uncharacterized protein ALTATR162_LOCUS6199 [Alternaria atra]|uniref:Heterokaryon incompatibility domain-containing protein n=1 Tax=Alternaria atra TaxID=119953 RepID=A0A8J2I403_9PLEO|nr:uncharacterized protein ALTATR162_LOCUS6199 [Alternaria atra]CAG5162325.1 unnamed protein product [Alternaria atra]